MHLSEADSILIIKPSSLGDIVHALPVLPVLKKWCPELKLSWVVNSQWASLVENNGYLDEVICFPRQELKGLRGLPRLKSWASELRQTRPSNEVALDLQGLLRSALIGKARGSHLIGYKEAREGAPLFYNQSVEINPVSSHEVDKHLSLLSALQVPLPEPSKSDRPSSYLCPLPEGQCPVGIELPSSYILLHPFARGAGKALSNERLQQLISSLAPAPVVLVGQPNDGDGDESWKANDSLPSHILNLCHQTSLTELIYLCRQASAVISVDSGPMHIAAAVAGDRLLGIHTWSDPTKVGPFHPGSAVWRDHRIASPSSFTELTHSGRQEAAKATTPSSSDIEKIAQWALATRAKNQPEVS